MNIHFIQKRKNRQRAVKDLIGAVDRLMERGVVNSYAFGHLRVWDGSFVVSKVDMEELHYRTGLLKKVLK